MKNLKSFKNYSSLNENYSGDIVTLLGNGMVSINSPSGDVVMEIRELLEIVTDLSNINDRIEHQNTENAIENAILNFQWPRREIRIKIGKLLKMMFQNPSIIVNEIDPFGEENWNDINVDYIIKNYYELKN